MSIGVCPGDRPRVCQGVGLGFALGIGIGYAKGDIYFKSPQIHQIPPDDLQTPLWTPSETPFRDSAAIPLMLSLKGYIRPSSEMLHYLGQPWPNHGPIMQRGGHRDWDMIGDTIS